MPSLQAVARGRRARLAATAVPRMRRAADGVRAVRPRVGWWGCSGCCGTYLLRVRAVPARVGGGGAPRDTDERQRLFTRTPERLGTAAVRRNADPHVRSRTSGGGGEGAVRRRRGVRLYDVLEPSAASDHPTAREPGTVREAAPDTAEMPPGPATGAGPRPGHAMGPVLLPPPSSGPEPPLRSSSRSLRWPQCSWSAARWSTPSRWAPADDGPMQAGPTVHNPGQLEGWSDSAPVAGPGDTPMLIAAPRTDDGARGFVAPRSRSDVSQKVGDGAPGSHTAAGFADSPVPTPQPTGRAADRVEKGARSSPRWTPLVKGRASSGARGRAAAERPGRAGSQARRPRQVPLRQALRQATHGLRAAGAAPGRNVTSAVPDEAGTPDRQPVPREDRERRPSPVRRPGGAWSDILSPLPRHLR